MIRFLTGLGLILFASVGSAHHGSTSQFDQSTTIQVGGVVTKIRFVNPHSYVYFDVAAEDGSTETWRCEMRAGSILKRFGWSTDMFTAGTRISIEGSPAWREPQGCYVRSFSLDGGETIARAAVFESADTGETERQVLLADGTPNLNGNWVAPPRNSAAAEAARALTANASPNTGPAPGPTPGRGGERYTPTEAGKAAVADFDREDNPRFHCEATNIFFDWTFDQHVNQIAQNNDAITLTYGFMDIVRTIHLNMAEHPENIEPSRIGHSIGKWEGSTLVVDTIGFTSGFLTTRPSVKHSNQLHMTERFSVSEDGKWLTRTYTGEDPLFLTKPFEGGDTIGLTDVAFDPYECEDLTEEVVPGF